MSTLAVGTGFAAILIFVGIIIFLQWERTRQKQDQRMVRHEWKPLVAVIREPHGPQRDKIEAAYQHVHRARQSAEDRRAWLSGELNRILDGGPESK